MTDIYDIKSMIDFLPFLIFLSLLSLIILMFIYTLLSKIFHNKWFVKNDIDKQILEPNFHATINDLYDKIDILDRKIFIKDLHILYSKYLTYNYWFDISSKTLEEIQKLDIIDYREIDILSNIYNLEYSWVELSKNDLINIFDRVKNDIVNNKNS